MKKEAQKIAENAVEQMSEEDVRGYTRDAWEDGIGMLDEDWDKVEGEGEGLAEVMDYMDKAVEQARKDLDRAYWINPFILDLLAEGSR